MEKKIPKTDRNGNLLEIGEFVRVFLNHGNRNFVAKVIQVGTEKSILQIEGRRSFHEPVDNQNLEILSSLLTELVEVKTKTSSFYLTKVL